MFIRNSHNGLVFLKSKNVSVFPCSRRRGFIDINESSSDKQYIPFDPEARVNTEANNRKHTSLNGFTQSYLNFWKTVENPAAGILSVVLNGYFFNITLNEHYCTPTKFGNAIAGLLGEDTASIYANVKLADVTFFSGTAEREATYTEILRDQTIANDPINCLDVLIETGSNTSDIDVNDTIDINDPSNYYFSGLSFSSYDKHIHDEDNKVTSIKLLEKVGGNWKIYEPSRLPKILHGETENSVEIEGDLTISCIENAYGNLIVEGAIYASEIFVGENNKPIVTLDLNEKAVQDGNRVFQLSFEGATVNMLPTE